jgi:hypothetical protein
LSPRKFTFFISQAFSNSLEASTYKSDVRNIKNKIPLALELKVRGLLQILEINPNTFFTR